MQDYIGNQFDHYKIISQEGIGTFSVIYKAYDTHLERDVALKLIHKESFPQDQNKRLLELFEKEAKAQVDFNHQHVVPIYDYGDIEGSPYLVMKYIPDGTLKARTGEPIPHKKVISWLLPILDALNYAHKRGVIHQDIKPSNILVDEQGDLLLSDFGIASVIKSIQGSLAETSISVGTPEYMAPEQFNGQASEASDQYAIGVVLYELLTGHNPFKAESPKAILANKMLRRLVSPSNLCSEVPAELDRILIKALAKEPGQRYKDVTAFKKALEIYTSIESAELEGTARKVIHHNIQPDMTPIPESGQETGLDNLLDSIPVQNMKDPTQVQADSTETSSGLRNKTLSGCAVLTGGLVVSLILLVLLLSVFDIGKGSPLAGVINSFRIAFLVEDTQSPEILEQSETTTTLVVLPSNTTEFTKTPTNTSTHTPTFTSTVVILKAKVIVDNALLRSGPDFSHPIISERLKQGSSLIVISKIPLETWFLVTTEDGLEGWLFTDWIELDVPIVTIPIESSIPTPLITNTAAPVLTPTPAPPAIPNPTATPKPTDRPPQYP